MAPRTVSVWGGPGWLAESRGAEATDAARELEQLGYARLWLSAGFAEGFPPGYGELLDATSRIGVASGILSIWHATPEQAAAGFAALEQKHPGRFLLGLGTSHAVLVDSSGAEQYRRPYRRMVAYLDALDAADPPVPADRRVLAALGPRMLALARDRAAGAHPYLVPVEHTREARSVLGEGPLLAPEVAVVLEIDEAKARAVAHAYLEGYLRLPNYTNNLRRFGWSDDDLAGGGSDRLLDALIPWGDVDRVVAGVEAHFEAGADEVPVQVLTERGDDFPLPELRTLAAALLADARPGA